MKDLAVIVCGGRDFDDKMLLVETMENLRLRYNFCLVIAGAARGADTLAAQWAKDRGVVLKEIPADWEREGRRAGYLRNKEMLRHLLAWRDVDPARKIGVVAFPGGKGTAMMAEIANLAGVPVLEVET